MDDVRGNIAMNIRKYRKIKGISQKEFASLIGISASAESKWETGKSKPKLIYLGRIATVLDISIQALFDN